MKEYPEDWFNLTRAQQDKIRFDVEQDKILQEFPLECARLIEENKYPVGSEVSFKRGFNRRRKIREISFYTESIPLGQIKTLSVFSNEIGTNVVQKRQTKKVVFLRYRMKSEYGTRGLPDSYRRVEDFA